MEDGLSEARALYVSEGGYRDVRMREKRLLQPNNTRRDEPTSRGGAAVRSAKRDDTRTGQRNTGKWVWL